MRRIIQVVCCILSCLVLCVGCRKDFRQRDVLEPVELGDTTEETKKAAKEKAESIFVYVCGAVNKPGVYELPKGSRLYEAIETAGGFREDAAVTVMNQAEVLEDEETICVPTKDEAEKGQASENGKINLNTATKAELMTLNGIGEARADSIIQYREEQGKFRTIEDLKQIDGIKDGLFEKIKDSITV